MLLPVKLGYTIHALIIKNTVVSPWYFYSFNFKYYCYGLKISPEMLRKVLIACALIACVYGSKTVKKIHEKDDLERHQRVG